MNTEIKREAEGANRPCLVELADCGRSPILCGVLRISAPFLLLLSSGLERGKVRTATFHDFIDAVREYLY
ncbi:MAG: hypothetical protein DMF61_12855 [Blastocatellia bacterium AA13]|nr:MAG: hypothetical protein DMF61_12855 [Blastocatellia bacterium AA13]